jgi:uncharacterized protein
LSNATNGIAAAWPVRRLVCTLIVKMRSYRTRNPVRAASTTIARGATLILIAILPLAAFSSGKPSIQVPEALRIVAPAEPFLQLDVEALSVETAEDTVARVFATMVVVDGEEFEPPPPPPSTQSPPSLAGLRFWAGGDSTATYMSIKLVDRFTDLGAGATGAYYQKSTGLARPDYFDWMAQLRAVMRGFQPDIMVFMVGANDTQGIRDANGATQWPFSDEWRALYAGRVGEVMDLLQAGNGYVVYVGQPNMGPTSFAEKMAALNEIIKAEADKRPRVGYIDAWSLFSDESGAFQPVLPDRDGVPTLFRAADGIHFTWAGGDHLAQAVLDEIYRQVIERPIAGWWLPPADVVELLP